MDLDRLEWHIDCSLSTPDPNIVLPTSMPHVSVDAKGENNMHHYRFYAANNSFWRFTVVPNMGGSRLLARVLSTAGQDVVPYVSSPAGSNIDITVDISAEGLYYLQIMDAHEGFIQNGFSYTLHASRAGIRLCCLAAALFWVHWYLTDSCSRLQIPPTGSPSSIVFAQEVPAASIVSR